MIDYEDWIFEELKIYKSKYSKTPFFISSWDCDSDLVVYPNKIISQSSEIAKDEFHYKFSEDLEFTKETLKNYYCTSNRDWHLNNFSLGINSTNSIYLALSALIKKGKKRFLLVTPIYYSIIDTLLDFSRDITFFHLRDLDEFRFDSDRIEQIVKQQYIEVIIFSDPVYCAGLEIGTEIYERIVKISNAYKVTVFIDGTLGGLEWRNDADIFFSREKTNIIKESYDFFLINSGPKLFFLNDLKFSVVISLADNIALIEDLSSQISGGLNKIQVNLFRLFYAESARNELYACKSQNISTIRNNYNLLSASLIGTDWQLYPTNSGYFTMLVSKKVLLGEVDPIDVTKKLLYGHNLLPIMGNYFSFFQDNKVSIRINLMKNLRGHLPALTEALNMDI